MPKFDVRKVEAVTAKQELDELVIDGVGQLELFEAMLEEDNSRYRSEFRTMISYMEYAANGRKHLRVYAIKKLNGKIIILGGFKNTQKADFKLFRSIKKQYLDSL